jgi:hypothetical protein
MKWLVQYLQSAAGLPDYSWCNIPKGENIYQIPHNIPNDIIIHQMAIKCTKWPQNITNGAKIYQMDTKYKNVNKYIPNGHKYTYQHPSLQDPPKCTQIGISGLKVHMYTIWQH